MSLKTRNPRARFQTMRNNLNVSAEFAISNAVARRDLKSSTSVFFIHG